VFACTSAVITAVAVAGCGPRSTADSSSKFKGEQRLVANTIEDLQDAGQRREASTICSELLAADLVRKIRRAAGGGRRTCAQGLKTSLDDADDFELTVKRVTISGKTASAVVVSGASGSKDRRTDTVRLVKEGRPARWRVADLG
jgi:hypothetical protein